MYGTYCAGLQPPTSPSQHQIPHTSGKTITKLTLDRDPDLVVVGHHALGCEVGGRELLCSRVSYLRSLASPDSITYDRVVAAPHRAELANGIRHLAAHFTGAVWAIRAGDRGPACRGIGREGQHSGEEGDDGLHGWNIQTCS